MSLSVRANPFIAALAALKVNPAMRTLAIRLTVRGQHIKWEHLHFTPLSQRPRSCVSSLRLRRHPWWQASERTIAFERRLKELG